MAADRQSCLDAALHYAGRGWRVLPVRAGGKVPLTRHGVKDANTDPETIRMWWARWPSAGVAIACGQAGGGVVVVDVDQPAALAVLEAHIGGLPTTRRVRTGRGFHLYFSTTDAFVTQRIADGIELRGDGAYVVAPPSRHPDGGVYELLDDREPIPLPNALRALLAQAQPKVEPEPAATEKIHEGERNRMLTSLAGTMRRRGMTAEAIRAALLTENAGRCEPPLPNKEVHTIAKSVARYAPPPELVTGPKAAVDASPLVNRIRQIALAEEIPLFDKRRDIARLVENDLKGSGQFFRTGDERGFFFHKTERCLYDVEQSSFERLVVSISGLSSTENFFKFALDLTQTNTLRNAPVVDVHCFSHFDSDSGLLAVSDGGPGIWVRERGGEWGQLFNGDEGLFFLTDEDSTAWVPDLKNNGESRLWWLSLFLFTDDGLSAEDSKTLLHLWLTQQFFPSLRRTRIVPCFLGPQGSGKTTAIRLVGRLLTGEKFDVTGVQRDREDAFVAAATNRVLLGLDNADSRISWLPDALSLYATGQRYRLRKLYTTNEEASYAPRAILLVSSRDPRFNRADVSERLLPLHFSRPEVYQTESEIFRELENRRGQIMGSLLVHAAEIVDLLGNHRPKPVPFRMADFASFGERIFAAHGKSEEFVSLLGRLERKQAEFASELDGLIEAIRILLQGERMEQISISDLHKKCSEIAKEGGLLIPRSAQGFGRHLSNVRRIIELELGVRIAEARGHAGKRMVSFISTKEKELVAGGENESA